MISRVFLVTVETPSDKLQKILEICEDHFDRHQKLLIKTDSLQASRYLDDYLWRTPRESFLPHSIGVKEKIDDCICITHTGENLNEATCCLNLTKEALIPPSFTKIYDFDDKTSVEKERLSQFRFQMYKKSAIPITALALLSKKTYNSL